jgi:hypothetical protein
MPGRAKTDYVLDSDPDEVLEPEEPTAGPDSRHAMMRRSDIEVVEQRNRILKLRRDGLTADQIQLALAEGRDGKEPWMISPSSIKARIRRYVVDLTEADTDTALVLREIANDRLERMFSRLEIAYAQAEGDPAERRQALLAQLKVIEVHSKLNGLNMPERVEVGLNVNVSSLAHPDHVAKIEREWAPRGRLGLPSPAHGEPG